MIADPRVAALETVLRDLTAEDGWPRSTVGIRNLAAAILAALRYCPDCGALSRGISGEVRMMAKAPEITVTVRDLPEVKAALERAAKIAVAGDALAEAVRTQHHMTPLDDLDGVVIEMWCDVCDLPESFCWAVPALAAWKEATDGR